MLHEQKQLLASTVLTDYIHTAEVSVTDSMWIRADDAYIAGEIYTLI